MRLAALLAGLTLLLAGCQLVPLSETDDAPPGTLVIRYGTSFGLCQGYCHSEYRLTAETITWTRVGRPAADYPVQTKQWPVDPDVWPRLHAQAQTLLQQNLDAVYGCPDCADGGAEWIEVEDADGPRKVTFEYGHPPDALAAFRSEIRHLLGGEIGLDH